jgi:hypothetical protein
MVAEAPDAADQMCRPSVNRDICLLWEGTNTIAALNLGAAKALTIKYCNDRRVAGFRVVAVGTILKRLDGGANNAAIEAMRLQYNAWLTATYLQFADVLVPFAADPRLDISITPSNFNTGVDLIHINDSGSTIAASILYQSISVFL